MGYSAFTYTSKYPYPTVKPVETRRKNRKECEKVAGNFREKIHGKDRDPLHNSLRSLEREEERYADERRIAEIALEKLRVIAPKVENTQNK